jgi:hypothetical protein
MELPRPGAAKQGQNRKAFIELRRFEEAIVAAKKAQRQNPSWSVTFRCFAAAFAHLGRDVEARDAAARLLEVDPDFTISSGDRSGRSNKLEAAHRGSSESGVARMSLRTLCADSNSQNRLTPGSRRNDQRPRRGDRSSDATTTTCFTRARHRVNTVKHLVPVGNLIRLVREVESRNASAS